MNVRAVLFDVYNTLLEVGPAPRDAESRWKRLWQQARKRKAPMSLADFDAKSREIIAAQNRAAEKRGIAFPEVYWPHMAKQVLPALASFTEVELDDFLYEHARLERTVRLPGGAARILRGLVRRKMLLGICSNAQPYTLRELADALSGVDLSPDIFHPELCFYSFQAGFSKPNPKVFRRLTQALRKTGIATGEVLLVGDRLDNDILPAKAQGWQSWHLAPKLSDTPGGGWQELAQFLFSSKAQ